MVLRCVKLATFFWVFSSLIYTDSILNRRHDQAYWLVPSHKRHDRVDLPTFTARTTERELVLKLNLAESITET